MNPRYYTGVVNVATDIPYAGATFTHEVYDAQHPGEPLCVCETPEQARAVVEALHAAYAAGRWAGLREGAESD